MSVYSDQLSLQRKKTLLMNLRKGYPYDGGTKFDNEMLWFFFFNKISHFYQLMMSFESYYKSLFSYNLKALIQPPSIVAFYLGNWHNK